jgi:hypothetical protein
MFYGFDLINIIEKTLQWLTEGYMDVWRKCYGLFDTLPSNIQLLSIVHYFRYVFGEQNFVILLHWSSPNVWMFLNNLRVNKQPTFEHPKTLGDVLQLGYINNFITLIWKVI